jgi:predicted nuclease with RNAse H fold
MAQDDILLGVDFSGAKEASSQRRKIIAIAARRIDQAHYRVVPEGMNARLLQNPRRPGWVAAELSQLLVEVVPASVVAFDFPFSIPEALLNSDDFAAAVGHSDAFRTWEAFNHFVFQHLPLNTPLDFSPFDPWRNKAYWLKRATDTLVGAQPALKDRFQVLFNMTLTGNALLGHLMVSDRYRIVPFHAPRADSVGEVIEIYPGFTMRALQHCAAQGISIEIEPTIRLFCETYNSGSGKIYDPDASDALIALVTAILYREGRCEEAVRPADYGKRAIEGAIWGPRLGP